MNRNIRTDKCLPKRRRDRGREQENGHNTRPHVNGCLGECVLESGNGGENLAHCDQDISTKA
jgi:hypothetical protein